LDPIENRAPIVGESLGRVSKSSRPKYAVGDVGDQLLRLGKEYSIISVMALMGLKQGARNHGITRCKT